MLPKFGQDHGNYGVELICPSCGFNCLHHEMVEVFERREDVLSGVHATVADAKATFDTSLEGNPSARRHGLKIYFWCEGCKTKPVLSISQHKGSTLVNFE